LSTAPLVTTAGTLVNASDIVLWTGAAQHPSVECNATRCLVTWAAVSGPAHDIFGALGDSQAKLVSPPGVFMISTATGDQLTPKPAFDGTNFFVVWTDARTATTTGNDIYGARVSTADQVLDSSGLPITTQAADQSYPRIAFDGTNHLVVWTDCRNGNNDIFGVLVRPGEQSMGYPNRKNVAFDGTNYFVVWQDDRNTATAGWEVFGARVTKSGVVLDPNGIDISCAAPNTQAQPSVSFGSGKYLVIWGDGRNSPVDSTYGARVSTNGSVIDCAGIPITNAPTGDFHVSNVGYQAPYFLAAIAGRTGGSPNWSIYRARIQP
jgi:hypothetical protein